MTKITKLIVLCIFLILSFSLCSCNSELISSQLLEPISASGSVDYYAALSETDRKTACYEKHIELWGIVSDVYGKTLEIGDESKDGIYFNCSFSATFENIEVGDLVKLHGVCTYVFSTSIYVEGCELIEHTKEDDIVTYVQSPYSNAECHKMTLSQLVKSFKEAGFENRKNTPVAYEYGNQEYKDNEVIKVLIAGDPADKSKTYSSTDLVEIFYADVPFAPTVIFGNYQQDQIEWFVLKTDEDKSLLVSKHSIAYMPFNEGTVANGTDWEYSSLREWLNNDFYSVAFSSDEKANIKQTVVQDYQADQKLGGTTTDRVFILSEKDTELYLSDNEGLYSSFSRWWLINSYMSDLYKVTVGSSSGYLRVNESAGVRPAIWVDNSILHTAE